jgi:CRISPR-associated endonuclease Csn1
MNKTLCFADENRAKGDKTPYEFYFEGQGEQKWEQVKAQALTCFKNKPNYSNSYAKFKQFVKQKHESDFISRQLNDTRYISKEAKNYLSKVCENVQVSPGQMTANLRQKWGLNSILNDDNKKSRDDHRHHAIDALVMACSTRSHLQELSKWNRHNRNAELKDFAMPWTNFLQDADKAINQILVSHKKIDNVLTIRTTKVKKNGEEFKNVGIAARGQLHKEFVYGKRQAPNSEKAFHIRKPIESLTTNKHVEKVVDPVIRQLILKRIEELGGFEKGTTIPKDTFYKVDENGVAQPQIFLPNKNGEPVPIKKVRIRENIGGAEQLKDINQYVNPRSNHHVLVYKTEKDEFSSRVVSFWEAVERKQQKQDVIQLPTKDKNGKIVTTLQINDMFLLAINEKEIDFSDTRLVNNHLYRVQKTSKKPDLTMKEVCFRKAIDSRSDKEAGKDYIYIKGFGDGKTGWQTFNPIKVKITPTGKIEKI